MEQKEIRRKHNGKHDRKPKNRGMRNPIRQEERRNEKRLNRAFNRVETRVKKKNKRLSTQGSADNLPTGPQETCNLREEEKRKTRQTARKRSQRKLGKA